MMTLRIAIFAAFISGILASPLLTTRKHDVGPKECAQGPEYWCLDLPKAKSCGAVTHCIQEVWQHMKLPEDKNEICDTCKKMVQEARDQLLSNETQEEIREVFEGTCHIYFPIKILADECIKYVDEYIPEMVEMLASRMDPQLVCSTAGLCNTAAIHGLLNTQKGKARPHTPSVCQDCKTFVDDTKDILKNHSKEEVKDRLLEICSSLGAQYSNPCKIIIETKFDDIYNYLMNGLDADEFCSLVGMCDETNNKPQIKSLIENFVESRKADPECDFCEQLVTYLKNVLTTNTTEEEFKNMLLGICQALGSMADECQKIVNENFQEIYDFLTAELDPELVCTALGICQKGKSEVVPMLPLVPAQLESNSVKDAPYKPIEKLSRQDADKKNIFIKFPFSKKTQLKGAEKFHHPETNLMPKESTNEEESDIPCALCEYGLHQLQQMLMDNHTTEAIKNALEKVCEELPKTLNDQCSQFIREYGDAILALMAQEIDPSVICVELKLCPSNSTRKLDVKTKFPFTKVKPAKVKKLEAPLQNSIVDVSSFQLPPERLLPQILVKSKVPIEGLKMDGCDTCQMIVDYVDKLLEEEEVEEDITKVLEKVCGIVPPSAKDQCNDIIESYGPYVLQLIGQLADSRQVCQALEICPTPPGQVQLLGGKKCTYGPSYWCQSKFHAKACKAVKHCEDNYWKKQ